MILDTAPEHVLMEKAFVKHRILPVLDFAKVMELVHTAMEQ
jgi:hypothetical protein